MKTFLSVIDNISDWSGKIFGFLVVIATLVVVYGVVMRYAFNAPPIWAQDLSIYLCASTYLLGGAYALLSDAHVRVDVLYSRWSPRAKAIADLVAAPIFFAGVGVMAWLGADWTITAFLRGSTSGTIWNVIVWPIRSLIFLGAFLLFLQGIAKFVRDVAKAGSGGAA